MLAALEPLRVEEEDVSPHPDEVGVVAEDVAKGADGNCAQLRRAEPLGATLAVLRWGEGEKIDPVMDVTVSLVKKF